MLVVNTFSGKILFNNFIHIPILKNNTAFNINVDVYNISKNNPNHINSK